VYITTFVHSNFRLSFCTLTLLGGPQVQRELHLPLSEDEFTTAGPRPVLHPERNEFIYGLGESRGHLVKNGKRFTMEGRDALSYDWDEGSLPSLNTGHRI
jgi:hypothetical protein